MKILSAVLFVLSTIHVSADQLNHEIKMAVDPVNGTITVQDTITWLEEAKPPCSLLLNKKLVITKSSVPLELISPKDKKDFHSINSGDEHANDPDNLAGYKFDLPGGENKLVLEYSGNIHFELSDQKEEYARGFRDTMGSLSKEGIYLSGATYWYPHFDEELVTFSLDISMPKNWHIISQGSGSSNDGLAHWTSEISMDEIYLVGGPLVSYKQATGTIEAQVYLHDEDPALANKYLETTAQYIEMYRSLIGPYPYDKFALVENFWETGYGMPSFTLLGPRVIRMPFILHSSYPHEILHNWWGNSVFVDYEKGNWCEGLTAYEADHLIKEQRGQGRNYRRSTLQKYKNYVSEGKDFPIIEFRSRHSAATEAVGYGKTLMLFHMLRKKVSDETFNRSLASFFRSNKGKKASFSDLKSSFEQTSGQDLSAFFKQWVERKGAPKITLTKVDIVKNEKGFSVNGILEQTQKDDVFELEVPVYVQTETGYQHFALNMMERETSFELAVSVKPLRISVDPEYDTFRLLDPREIPSSIGTFFGSLNIVAILPAAEKKGKLLMYRELMKGWNHEGHQIKVMMDSELKALPLNETLWVVGLNNRFAPEILEQAQTNGLANTPEGIQWKDKTFDTDQHSFVVTVPTPDFEHAKGLIHVAPDMAFLGLGRKLPHYGKYSYLAFNGDEPRNVLKGQWATKNSPMEVFLVDESIPPLKIKSPPALAELPAVFSGKEMMSHIEFMSSEDRGGRGVGSVGIREVEHYIQKQFEDAGLLPGNMCSFIQTFEMKGENDEIIKENNVIGFIPGKNRSESVLVTAHYDHLGFGWPDAHKEHKGKLHSGADDNASGVALLLEFAKTYSKTFEGEEKPDRNLVFIAFSAEESGLLGSRYFVKYPSIPLNGIMGVINLDTIGRLEDKKLSILGTGNTKEWAHIFMGCGFVTGMKNQCIPGLTESSDQLSFVEAGIPAVQIFSGTHADYHRPGDTADKIDTEGMVKIATFVREAINYLLDREEPLNFIAPEKEKKSEPSEKPKVKSGRKVSFGTIPDMGFTGKGVKMAGATPGSPAAKAGLQEGDLLIEIKGTPIEDLRSFSNVLKTLEPGQKVKVVFKRGDDTKETEVTVVER